MKNNVLAVASTSVLQAAILLAGFGGLTYGVEVYNLQRDMADLRVELSEVGDLKRTKIEREINSAVLMARALSVAIELEPDSFDQARYSKFASKMIADNPSVLNVAAAPDLVVKFVYPVAENASVVGLNYRQNKAQFAAAKQAMDLGEPVLAGPLDLVQGGTGFILRNVIHSDRFEETGREKWGIISVVLDKEKFLAQLRSPTDGVVQKNAIRQVQSYGPNQIAYAPVMGDQSLFDGKPVILDINVPSGKWQIALHPINGWPVVSTDFIRNTLILAVLFSGIFGLILIAHWFRRGRETADIRLRTALEAYDQSFALYDSEDRLTLCNSQFMRDHKLTQKMVNRRPTFEEILRAGLKANRFAASIQQDENWLKLRLEKHKEPASVTHVELADGRWFKVSEQTLENRNVIAFATDITELVKAKQLAESSEKTKMRFLDAVSHELKTPLSVLLGYNAFLEHPEHLKSVATFVKTVENDPTLQRETGGLTPVTDEIKAHAGKIKAAGLQLQALINNVLEFTSSEDGPSPKKTPQLRAGQVVGPIAERFRKEASQKGLEFSVIIEETGLQADPLYVDHVLSKMVENAIKTTDFGSVRVTVQPCDDVVKIMVRDTGTGVFDTDDAAEIQRGFQSDIIDFIASKDPKAAFEGARNMGGDITVDRDRSVGKLVIFTLPRTDKGEIAA